MTIRGRSSIAAFMACLILLVFFAAPAYPSYNTEAGRKYAVASQRLADLRKSSQKKKYRSYWMDCIRTFEMVEKKYPKSPSAAEACFDRASLYSELYRYNKYSRDLDSSMKEFAICQSTYPTHKKAPEALYRIIDLSVSHKRNPAGASKAYTKLVEAYPSSIWTERSKGKLGNEKVNSKPAPAIANTNKTAAPEKVGFVRNIRYWSGGGHTRIVIDQERQFKYQVHELKKPDRLVFDLAKARIGDSINKELPVNDGILQQVRAGQYDADTVRIVLDLASIKNYIVFPLHDPERLVIDVNGENKGDSTTAGLQGAGAGGEHPGQSAPADPMIPMVIPPVRLNEGTNDSQNLSLSRQLGLKIKTIAIDAGHGGHDPGAIGKYGLQEKVVTLDIAKRLAVLVKDRLGCNVVMTRERDVFIPLEERPFIAKSKGADLFLSIHVNASPRPATRGIEMYVQSLTASDRGAMATAARENAMSTKKLSQLKSELDRIFADLTRDNKIEESMYLADAVQGSLVNNLKALNKHADALQAKVKRAFFYVLINTEMPSILAEVGFISNSEEEKLLKQESYRQSIAEGLYEGVKKYVEARSPQMMGI